MKRITKDEWFAAASAQDLWTIGYLSEHISCSNACNKTGAILGVFNELYWLASRIFVDSLADETFLAAQIGCEKAGL
jgi:hypothetical protein